MSSLIDRDTLIRVFKQRMQGHDKLEDRFSHILNLNAEGGPSRTYYLLRAQRYSIRTQFLFAITDSYRSEIDNNYHQLGRSPKDIENEMYRNIKDWGNEGYLDEKYVDLASRLQRDAQPVKSIIDHILDMALSVAERMTGAEFFFGNPNRSRLELEERVRRLSNEICVDGIEVKREAAENVVNFCPPHPDDSEIVKAVYEEMDNLARYLQFTYPRHSPQRPDEATLQKEAAERQKRLHTYQRESAAAVGELCMNHEHQHRTGGKFEEGQF